MRLLYSNRKDKVRLNFHLDEIETILFELKTIEMEGGKKGNDTLDKLDKLENDPGRIVGLENFAVEIYQNVPVTETDMITLQDKAINFKIFPSGSAICLKSVL